MRTISSVCPQCGTIAKTGKSSCCGRGGSWFRNCGSAGNAKLRHTWYEGIRACKTRSQLKTASGQQPNAAQQLNYGSSTANSKVGIRDAKTFTFAPANTPGIFSPVNVSITRSARTSMTNISTTSTTLSMAETAYINTLTTATATTAITATTATTTTIPYSAQEQTITGDWISQGMCNHMMYLNP